MRNDIIIEGCWAQFLLVFIGWCLLFLLFDFFLHDVVYALLFSWVGILIGVYEVKGYEEEKR